MTAISADLAASLTGRLSAMSAAIASAEVIEDPPPPGAGFGVNVASTVLPAANQAARLAFLADVAELGARYVRLDVTWAFIEPTAGNRTWGFYDAVMDDIKASGLEPIMLIAYGNTAYGSPSNMAPPPDHGDYAAFAGAVAARYSQPRWGFHVYQAWNEPNLASFWGGPPNAAAYVNLLAEASAAIRAADPAATVLTAGIAPAGVTAYVSAMYAAGARPHFDGLAIHPYIGEGADSMWDVRGVMNANGDTGKLVWATEFGWSTWPTPGNSEALQASRFTQAAGWWRDPQQGPTGAFVAYTHRDTGAVASNPEHWFGLLRPDGTRKPAWTAFRDLVAAG